MEATTEWKMGDTHSSPTVLGLWTHDKCPRLTPKCCLGVGGGTKVFYPPRQDYRRFEIPSFIFTTQYSASTGVNELWDTLKHFTLSFLKDKVPSKMTSSRFSQPWINKKVKRISRRKKRVHKRAKQSCSISDLQRYRQLQKEPQYECKKAYDSYVGDIVTSDKNSKKLYTFIKCKKCDSSGGIHKGGITHSDPRTKATIMNEQFSSVIT